jgi:hypothetical protein
MVIAPDASGSGNWLTPLSRMHCANFIACSWFAAVLLRLLASVGACEQPAQAQATTARAASGPATRVLGVRWGIGRSGSRWVTPPIQDGVVLPARIWFSICPRYAPGRSIAACGC